MKSRANGWLRRWLINPLAFCFSHEAPKAQPAFSVPDVLKAPRKILIVPDGRAGGLFLGAPQFPGHSTPLCRGQNHSSGPCAQSIYRPGNPFCRRGDGLRRLSPPPGRQTPRSCAAPSGTSVRYRLFLQHRREFLPRLFLLQKRGHTSGSGSSETIFLSSMSRLCRARRRVMNANASRSFSARSAYPRSKTGCPGSVSKAGAKEIRGRYLVSRKPGERFVGLDVSTCTGNRPTVKQLRSIAEVATALANTRTLVFFDSTERKAANRIKATLGQKVLLCQTDDLPKTVALLEACHQLIACNTDLFHLAVAMGLPVTGIFSSSDIARWVPADRKGVEILEYETLKNWRPQQVSNTIQQRALIHSLGKGITGSICGGCHRPGPSPVPDRLFFYVRNYDNMAPGLPVHPLLEKCHNGIKTPGHTGCRIFLSIIISIGYV